MDPIGKAQTPTQAQIQVLRARILAMPRILKQGALLTADITGMSICVILATWIVDGVEAVSMPNMILISGVATVLTLPIAWQQGLYRSIIRYVGLDLFAAGTRTALLVGAIAGIVVYLLSMLPNAARWSICFCVFALVYLIGGRFIARILLSRRLGTREAVIVYGAGDGGARLTAALKNGNEYEPVALVDDNMALHGKRVNGVEIYSPSSLSSLIETTKAARVLLAMPSASRYRRRAVLEHLSDFPVHVQTIPEISDLVTGKARVDDIRDVDVVDLLGRDTVPPEMKLLRASITGKCVMVTGAGGSIGSELCRQIIHLGPKCVVLFELSEIALYNIEKELRYIAMSQEIDCEFVSILGSVHHKDRVREALRTFRVCTVYHAAAYKHVPIVEHNLLEGVHNNIFGTLHVAEASIDSGVETFVLISTDKAVSPTSVMGATKRFAELILQALQDEYSSTRFSMVRFGNVLASSGSVVPLFREQIRSGGPVTVTHREIIRYFMTIPEAAQLVIQAGAMATGGDVFVLDMGQPVKIRDLARRMINLMGLTVRDETNPDGDIAIAYTGLRPGEKLYEELLIGNNVSGTGHPRIMRASEDYIGLEVLKPLINTLRTAALDLDRNRARDVLMQCVSGYKPTNGIDDVVWVRTHGLEQDSDEDKVIDFPTRRA